jgi:hypothetical protein
VGTGLVTDVLIREHGSLSKIRRRVEGLGPYQSLLLLAVAMSIVEPLKLIALAIAGDGHWVTHFGDRRRLRHQPASR